MSSNGQELFQRARGRSALNDRRKSTATVRLSASAAALSLPPIRFTSLSFSLNSQLRCLFLTLFKHSQHLWAEVPAPTKYDPFRWSICFHISEHFLHQIHSSNCYCIFIFITVFYTVIMPSPKIFYACLMFELSDQDLLRSAFALLGLSLWNLPFRDDHIFLYSKLCNYNSHDFWVLDFCAFSFSNWILFAKSTRI